MAFLIRFGPDDCARLDVPAEIEVDLSTLTQVEAEILDDHGIDADYVGSYLRGTPVLNEDGTPRLDADGDPVTRAPVRGLRLLAWVALRRAGKQVPFDGFDFARHLLKVDSPAPKEPETSSTTESPSET